MKSKLLFVAAALLALAPGAAQASPYPHAEVLEARARETLRTIALDASAVWGGVFGVAVFVGCAAELLKRVARQTSGAGDTAHSLATGLRKSPETSALPAEAGTAAGARQ